MPRFINGWSDICMFLLEAETSDFQTQALPFCLLLLYGDPARQALSGLPFCAQPLPSKGWVPSARMCLQKASCWEDDIKVCLISDGSVCLKSRELAQIWLVLHDRRLQSLAKNLRVSTTSVAFRLESFIRLRFCWEINGPWKGGVCFHNRCGLACGHMAWSKSCLWRFIYGATYLPWQQPSTWCCSSSLSW